MFSEYLRIPGHWLVIQFKRREGRIEQGLGNRVDLLAVNQWIVGTPGPVPAAGSYIGVQQKLFKYVWTFITR